MKVSTNLIFRTFCFNPIIIIVVANSIIFTHLTFQCKRSIDKKKNQCNFSVHFSEHTKNDKIVVMRTKAFLGDKIVYSMHPLSFSILFEVINNIPMMGCISPIECSESFLIFEIQVDTSILFRVPQNGLHYFRLVFDASNV